MTASVEPTLKGPGRRKRDDEAVAWLMEWAATADQNAIEHYDHIQDGEGDSCGCYYEGGDVR